MFNYLLDIKPLEDLGLDDSAIAAHLSSRTLQPIPCEDAKVLLEGSGVVVEDPVTQQRSGLLISHYTSLPEGSEKSLLSWFISHTMGRGVQITSDSYPRSIQLAAVVSGLPASLDSIAEQIIALGGGQPDVGTTATAVSDARNDYISKEAMYQRQETADEKWNEFLSPVLDDVAATDADIAAALVAWSNSYTE